MIDDLFKKYLQFEAFVEDRMQSFLLHICLLLRAVRKNTSWKQFDNNKWITKSCKHRQVSHKRPGVHLKEAFADVINLNIRKEVLFNSCVRPSVAKSSRAEHTASKSTQVDNPDAAHRYFSVTVTVYREVGGITLGDNQAEGSSSEAVAKQ